MIESPEQQKLIAFLERNPAVSRHLRSLFATIFTFGLIVGLVTALIFGGRT